MPEFAGSETTEEWKRAGCMSVRKAQRILSILFTAASLAPRIGPVMTQSF